MNAEPHTDASDSSNADPEPGPSARLRRESVRLRWAWLGAGLLVLASFGWMRLSIGGPRGTLLFSNLVLISSATAATAALGLLARRSERPDALGSQYGGDVWIDSSELGGAAFVVELRRYRE